MSASQHMPGSEAFAAAIAPRTYPLSPRSARDLIAGIRANLGILRSDLRDLRTDLRTDLRYLRTDIRDDWRNLAWARELARFRAEHDEPTP